jgi:hypothetical protein
MNRRCARCRSPLDPGDRACGECGLRVSEPGPPEAASVRTTGITAASATVATPVASVATRCPACGSAVAPGDRACGDCGARLVHGSGDTSNPLRDAPHTPPRARVEAADTRHEGSGAHVLYVVSQSGAQALDAVLSSRGEVLAVPSSEAALARVQARLREGRRPDAVCVIGDDRAVPMARVEDPAGHDDAVLTDNFFGRATTPSQEARFRGDLLPEVPVSRIPSGDPAFVAQLLSAPTPLCPTWTGGFALSAAVWKGASRAVAETLYGARGPALQLSPPADERTVASALAGLPGRLYFNVHGSGDEPCWVGEGEGRYVPVLRAEAIRVAPGAVVVSEACFSAMDFPEDGGGLGEPFLRAGAGAFVGSTIIAWGPPEPPPSAADLVVLGFYDAIDRGLPAGAAMLDARGAILDAVLEEGRGLAPPEHNTLLSFVHYGAPFARVVAPARKDPAAAPRGLPSSPHTLAPKGAGGSALDRIRGRMAGATAGSSPLHDARARLGARLSPGDWEVLSSGRVALGALPTMFRRYDEVTKALRGLLGAAPGELSLLRFRAGARQLAHVSASVVVPGMGARAAALLVDADGCELKRWVARGGRAAPQGARRRMIPP